MSNKSVINIFEKIFQHKEREINKQTKQRQALELWRCPSYFSIAMTRLHGQGILKNKAFNLGLMIPENSKAHDYYRGEHGSRQAQHWSSSWELTCWDKKKWDRKRGGEEGTHLKRHELLKGPHKIVAITQNSLRPTSKVCILFRSQHCLKIQSLFWHPTQPLNCNHL